MRASVRVLAPVISMLALALAPLLPAAADDGGDASAVAVSAPQYQVAQLDQLLAPVALYPDALLGQILMASTYPLEIVEADRWLHGPGKGLQGTALDAALGQQRWDPSVKSLVPFPQVLDMLDTNLDWTEELGNAFLAQQGDVSASVQRLRRQAMAAGTLNTTQQQQVAEDSSQDITIDPADATMVYLPMYDPNAVYGAWAYPDYPPYYFPWPDVDVSMGIVFGFGFAVVGDYWGWDRWDWGHGRITVNGDRFNHINGRHPPIGSGPWTHDPQHRHGVPYASPAVRAQYRGSSPGLQLRGYGGGRADHGFGGDAQGGGVREGVVHGNGVPENGVHESGVREGGSPPRQQAAPEHAEAPAFESYGSGASVRSEEARGAYSRQQSAPAERAGGGWGGGGGGGGHGGGGGGHGGGGGGRGGRR